MFTRCLKGAGVMRKVANLVGRLTPIVLGLALAGAVVWLATKGPEAGDSKPVGGSFATRPKGTPGTFTYTDSNGEVTTVETGYAPGENPEAATPSAK
jgi:hypothetical protein